MNGRRRPRVPRRITLEPMKLAMNGVSKPRKEEVDQLLDAVRQANKALREGVATLSQWSVLAGTLDVAMSIERRGVVRGLREYLASADLALKAVFNRGNQLQGWCPVHLEFDELDAVQEFVDLYYFQMRQLSREEFDTAINRASKVIRGQGENVAVTRDLERLAA